MKWEYMTCSLDTGWLLSIDEPNMFSTWERTLNSLGEDGWELVSVTANIKGYYYAILKRPKKASRVTQRSKGAARQDTGR